MGFFYKKCEVCGNKINKLQCLFSRYALYDMECNKCNSKYQISKFVNFYPI